MIIPSELVRRIAGTYIEDDPSPKPPLQEWLQIECRTGCFREAIEECARQQAEPLRPDLVLVEKIEPAKITLRLPCRVVDHESTSPFAADVTFELDPMTLRVTRV